MHAKLYVHCTRDYQADSDGIAYVHGGRPKSIISKHIT